MRDQENVGNHALLGTTGKDLAVSQVLTDFNYNYICFGILFCTKHEGDITAILSVCKGYT